jgi:prophage DNA circulation protein
MLADAGRWGISAADSLGLSDAVATLTGGASAAEIADGVRLGITAASAVMPSQAARASFLLASAQYAVEPIAVPWQTENRARAAQNEVATASLIRRAALSELAESTSSMTWDSYEDARAYMHEVGDTFNGEISRAGGDVPGESSASVFSALSSARAALVSDVSSRSSNLATLSSITLPGSKPAVVEAYRQYDDANRAADIVARNGITDPNRMSPGVALEYLSK